MDSVKRNICAAFVLLPLISSIFALTPLANVHHFLICVLSLWLPTFYYAKPLIFYGNIVF